ncbi:branched-chain amino acid ABC transporter substrate-binding protein [Rhodovulum sulfidophilum]|uniref:ABC transporter substrate-binding protein n=1 Tax=Rhodovulum visakhapatnamense TaxID=364297 RepID=A0ABS1RDB8_9RHOB|nr:ABC transporter substrate-binding protein [Rhodovulum visakhapatnamense]MBL3570181.1 ABC transporter substrate-binding protein [Rhodovulum visakhapatnamense]MBL3577618.1 ABC transporter substrate-binding protein [Rhodovulum visakhapatnamense]OLS43514.1 branched-chain amino acid ABC transporter substrate-binding protein [Rhodovulum sulfidophilum]
MKTWLLTALCAAMPLTAAAADKPASLKVGMTTFLTGPASVFGVPAKNAAEILVETINAQGGIGGVPVEVSFIDEGAGAETLTSEYRRLAESGGADVMFAAISSGNCQTLAPLAEDLKVINFMWDCGTQKIFEEHSYKYVFRTQANATPEMLAAVIYLLKTHPDFKTIAVVNQDYAWGRDSWDIFRTALMAMKPDVKVVGEFFPKFGSPDFSTEISRLQALRPDVILSTNWGGDLDTFVQQAAQRGLMNSSTFVLPLAESSLERLGSSLPSGHIVGARGDHYFRHPERRDDDAFKDFMARYEEKTGEISVYPVFHTAQAFAALQAVYEKAIAANGGDWPDEDQVLAAMAGLEFQGLGRPVTIREDHQGIEAQLMATSVQTGDRPFATLENIMIFDGADITAPVGEVSVDWIGGLDASFLDQVGVATYAD